MEAFLAALVGVTALAAVLGGLLWLAARVRRRGAGAAVMGPFEEIWHPAGHRARIEVRVQQERAVSMPSPGDRLR
ncbi:hypothetical protein [Plantactinospora soyae]|uniref:Secreted protein n=1 Tax=Plantactinospora soyae TaxID=1544732 RepID=A0A927M5B6_9ACTN|nr:hypothetical protein [Plantactinospora soyae]MBE1487242.1 hypothetical protein [Plantactinospora soyae]